MRRYISLLLFIGLAWGQEYDPETGEVVKKQYDPETGELVKDQSYPDSLALPSHPKVNSDLKNISIKHLTKEQKKKYNQNRIMIKKRGGIVEPNWYAYIKKGVFNTKILNKSDFFIITGYPEKNEIAKHNAQLEKEYILPAGLILMLQSIATETDNYNIGFGIIILGSSGYLYYDLKVKKLEGVSLKDAKIIAEEYNNDLMQKIFNENE
jgi:hypothetical protein